MNDLENNLNWSQLLKIGGIAAILEVVFLLGFIIVSITLPGASLRPESATEYFEIFQKNKLMVFLNDDFLSLIVLSLYLFIFPALFVALFRFNPSLTTLASLLSIVVAITSIATQSTFSMFHLGEQFVQATSEIEKNVLLTAAGEAIIASDMWHNSSGFLGGIFLQGAGVMISIIMLKSGNFSKITAFSGILANGFDLTQHLINYFDASTAKTIMMIAGPLYLVWYPFMGRDLIKISKKY